MDGRAGLIMAVVTGALVSAPGCGDDAAQRPPWVSGDRLRAAVVDGGDGAVAFRGWHDRELGAACAFATAADGVLRCLPTDTAFLVFRDAACTERAAVSFAGPDCPGPAYAAAPSALGCPDDPRPLYPLGAALGDGLVYFDRDGTCEPFVSAPLYAVGPAVEPSRFVAARVRTDDHGDGLAARVAIADDGAQQVLSLADATGASCGRLELSDGASVCVGTVAYPAPQLHADDACTAPAPAVTHRCQPAPDVVLDVGGVALAAGALPGPLYVAANDACAIDDTYTAWLPGRLATAADFPAAPTITTGAGALQLRWASDAAGAPLISEAFVDVARGTTCYAARLDGDAGRCLPPTMTWSSPATSFADAACTVPAWALYRDHGPSTLIGVTSAGACGAVRVDHLYLVTPHVGPSYAMSGAGCVLVPDAPTDHVYAATADLPRTDFPALTFRVE
ncbi:MAG: hypothetical protein JNK64_07925 [Myxococcales bacterium]|nr:hypothetical protein [Myxococcales bacterium]